MKPMTRTFLAFALMLAVPALMALEPIQLGENTSLQINADVRARWEGYKQAVASPDASDDGRHATQYLRVRTRLKLSLDVSDFMTVNVRFANRFHYVTTSPSAKNNNGKATWEFPDETIVDQANVVFKNLCDGNLSLTVGRQDIFLGNGFIFSEATPADQGRTVYADGITAKYKTETDTVTLLALYDSWKDRCVFINDRNRRLHSGDIFTTGAYWTHLFGDALSLDAYYFFSDVDDNHPLEAERNHAADCSDSLHTAGLRIFGKPLPRVDYSLEAARQFGRDAGGHLNAGSLVDARLNVQMIEKDDFLPLALGLEFTRFSGDHPRSRRNEGWTPLMSQCPLWGEELLPIMLNGMWNNLESYRISLSSSFTEKAALTLFATQYMVVDENGTVGATIASTGGGDNFGRLIGLTATYKACKMLTLTTQLSHFQPGNFFANGHDSVWGRFEVTLAF